MISISSSVFAETEEGWESGDIEVKNELIVYCERLYIFNYFCNSIGNLHKHIIYVEEDHERPGAEIDDKVDEIQVTLARIEDKFKDMESMKESIDNMNGKWDKVQRYMTRMSKKMDEIRAPKQQLLPQIGAFGAVRKEKPGISP